MKTVCPACGAALAPAAEQCDLCGTPVGADADGVQAPPPSDAAPPVPAAPTSDGAAFCIACGHRNPAEARFCNRCGTALPAREPADDTPPSPAETDRVVPSVSPVPSVVAAAPRARPSSEPGRRALRLVAVGLLAVVALYGVTALTRSGRTPEPAPAAPDVSGATVGGGPSVRLDPASVSALPLPDSLRPEAEAAASVAAGAERASSAAAWDDAGRLYLVLTERAPPEQRPTIARQAVAAFQRSLAIEESPDVRTRMAIAYQYDPANPMQAITELQNVLTSTPAHPEANYHMGVMRLQIGRFADAVGSFERAVAGAPAGSLLRREAEALLLQAREAAATTPSSPPATAPIGG